MTFSNRLKELRIEKQLTQKEVADILMVSRSTIGKYETGSAYPDFEKLIALANLYNCSTDYLLCISDNPKRHSELKLKFIDKILTLSVSEGFLSSLNNEEEYDKLYENLKLAYKTIKLIKNILINDSSVNKK